MNRKEILIFLAAAILLSQKIYAQLNYDDYAYLDKAPAFYDDFNDEKTGWVKSVSAIVVINEGNLVLKSISDKNDASCQKYAHLFADRNLEIETKIKFISGHEDYNCCLMFGEDLESKNRYNFAFTNNGYYAIDKSVGGKFQVIVDWTKSSLIRPNVYNKLTVRKLGDKYYYFLNEQHVYTMEYEPFFGNYFGFQVPKESVISIDYLRVSYLD